MKKRIKGIVWGCLLLQLQGCAMTIYNWKEMPDQEPVKNFSVSEKQTYYRQHAINGFKSYLFTGEQAFTTLDNPDKAYNLHSYAPFIYKIAPETEAFFEEARFWEKLQWFDLIFAFGLLAYELGDGFNLMKDFTRTLGSSDPADTIAPVQQHMIIYFAVLATGIILIEGLSLYFNFKESEQRAKIKDTYNAALRRELELADTESWLKVLPQPSFAITTGGQRELNSQAP